MAEAFIVGAVRTAVGKRNGGLSGVHPVDLGGACPARAGGPDRDRPGRGRRRDHGVRLADRPADLRHRPERLAVGGPARERARRHHRPAVRVLPAGGALRRPGRDVRHAGPGGRGRRGEHEHRPDGLVRHAWPMEAGMPAAVRPGLAGALRGPGDLPVPRRPADLREVGHQAEPAGGVRPGEPPARGPRHRRGPVRLGRSCRWTASAQDEGPRRDTSLEKMAGLAPLREDWEITAAVASQISDGAGALLIASEAALRRHGLTPLARIARAGRGRRRPGVHADRRRSRRPSKALGRAGLKVGDIDVFEVNEAFAPGAASPGREDTGASLDRTNPNGGAIALGHPLGATGAILMTKLRARAAAHRRPVRPADHVRGRRPGQRHDRRAGLASRLDQSPASVNSSRPCRAEIGSRRSSRCYRLTTMRLASNVGVLTATLASAVALRHGTASGASGNGSPTVQQVVQRQLRALVIAPGSRPEFRLPGRVLQGPGHPARHCLHPQLRPGPRSM